jgi:hypothetical protein
MWIRSWLVASFVAIAAMPAWADPQRPAPTAELLMARYASGGTSVLFAYPGVPIHRIPDFAIYSDRTVLMAEEGVMATGVLRMQMTVLPADIAQSRFRDFQLSLADAAPDHPYNCWNTAKDGKRRPYSCVDDAGTANILLMTSGKPAYRSISVYAGYHWRSLRGMREFVPPAYFNLMAWMDGLRDLPAQPWQSTDSALPGLAPADPACLVAQDLCR